jgi:alpha-glucosidase
MERGVSGFRIDAISILIEKMNPDGSFPDEPRSFDPNFDQFDMDFLRHIYTWNQPETYDMVYQWRKFVDEFTKIQKSDSKVLMIEAAGSVKDFQLYYTDGKALGTQIPFNFELIKRLTKDSNAEDYKTIIEDWLLKVPKGQFANWVVI